MSEFSAGQTGAGGSPHGGRREAEVVVIGAGPAGIAAATRAAESGRTVVLLDESPEVGGQIWRHRAGQALRGEAHEWIGRLTRSGVAILRGAPVVDLTFDAERRGYTVTAEGANDACLVHAHALVLATGARERFLPFPGWTLPGVIGVGAAQALHKSGVSFARKRVVIAGSGPLLLPVAAMLEAHGARVLLVAEQASPRAVSGFARSLWRRPTVLLQAARYRVAFAGTSYMPGTWIVAARGGARVQEVDLTDGVKVRTIACDVLCAAFGLVPNTELARLAGCTVTRGSVVVDERQETDCPGVFCAGETTGIGGMDLAIIEGEIAGLCSAGRDAHARSLHARRRRLRSSAKAMERAFAPRAELRTLTRPNTIVCRCEDVPCSAIDPTWTMRKAKLYTRAGMGPCQGRVCGAALEFLHGWPADTMRLPCEPALYSTLIADAATTAAAVGQGA